MIPSKVEHSLFPHLHHTPARFLFRVPPETGAKGENALAFTVMQLLFVT